MERYRSGHNGADSKSVCEQSHMGSNPILSAINSKDIEFLEFLFIMQQRKLHLCEIQKCNFTI